MTLNSSFFVFTWEYEGYFRKIVSELIYLNTKLIPVLMLSLGQVELLKILLKGMES